MTTVQDDEELHAHHLNAGDLQDRCVSVLVAGETYGIPIADVQEIIGARPVTRVFHAPPALAGVTSLRGEILAVLDLATLLGRAEVAQSEVHGSRIIVVREHAGSRRRAGLFVDGLGPVRDLPGGIASLVAPPATISALLRPFVRGLLAEPPLCAVLDVPALLDSPALAKLAGKGAS